jgi:hypothetical protein
VWGEIASAVAILAVSYPAAVRILRKPGPDTGNDDPRLIAAQKLCPWPTEGECRGAGETIRRGGDRAGQRPSFTHKIQHAIARHEKRPTP